MIAPFKPYPTLKDSNLTWLGMIPAHWGVKRGKVLFRCVDVRSESGDEELLTVSAERGVVPRASATVTMFKAESYAGYKLCWPGDLVINSLWAWGRGLGVSKHHGIVSSAYGVYRLRPPFTAYAAYIHELVRSVPFNWELQVRSKGIWISRLQLTDEAFLDAPFPIPPVEEAAAIVHFLDHADRRIRQRIRAKQKLIKLLEEQKRAIIHRAVTRGLDPNVRLKPSGVEWVGEVPEHWEVKRLGRLIVDGPRNGISPPVDEHGNVESFSISAVRDGVVVVRDEHKKYVGGDKAVLEHQYSLLAGDVLLVRGNGNIRLVGRAGLVEEAMPARIYPDLLMRMRLAAKCIPAFVVALLNSPIGRDQIETAARTAVATFKINNEQVRQLWFAWPSLSEQQRIVEWLSAELHDVNNAARRAGDAIGALKEFRNRLVADVVTGKLDVREMATRLPEILEESESLDEAESDSEEADEENGAMVEEAET